MKYFYFVNLMKISEKLFKKKEKKKNYLNRDLCRTQEIKKKKTYHQFIEWLLEIQPNRSTSLGVCVEGKNRLFLNWNVQFLRKSRIDRRKKNNFVFGLPVCIHIKRFVLCFSIVRWLYAIFFILYFSSLFSVFFFSFFL